jgi:C-terminal processing protease CtpA/Prc
MSPMIVGLSQLFPDGELFSFIYKNGASSSVILSNGSINAGGYPVKISADGKKLNVPIAIITGENTGSSGEMTLLCFRGLVNVQTFGQNTAGYATVNKSFFLYDGSIIQLTCATVEARTGEVFGEDPIAPNIQSTDAYRDAVAWLSQQ